MIHYSGLPQQNQSSTLLKNCYHCFPLSASFYSIKMCVVLIKQSDFRNEVNGTNGCVRQYLSIRIQPVFCVIDVKNQFQVFRWSPVMYASLVLVLLFVSLTIFSIAQDPPEYVYHLEEFFNISRKQTNKMHSNLYKLPGPMLNPTVIVLKQSHCPDLLALFLWLPPHSCRGK